jgi:hypothetical protein
MPSYLVGERGTIFGKKCKPLFVGVQNSGYNMVWLSDCGIKKAFTVHRIVASTWIKNPNNFPQVNHINGNKQDNSVKNLEWVTAKQNVNHAFDNGFMNESKEKARVRMQEIGRKYAEQNSERLRQFAKQTSQPVIQRNLDGSVVAEYESSKSAKRITGINNIHKSIKTGRPAGGYIWTKKHEAQRNNNDTRIS